MEDLRKIMIEKFLMDKKFCNFKSKQFCKFRFEDSSLTTANYYIYLYGNLATAHRSRTERRKSNSRKTQPTEKVNRQPAGEPEKEQLIASEKHKISEE